MKTIGTPVSRLDGKLKVTGGARYAADVVLPGLVHAVIVGAKVPAGEIITLDTKAADASPGVIKVLTHRNVPKLAGPLDSPPAGQKAMPLQSSTITFEGEPIAVVVAGTLEEATEAARRIHAEYRGAPFVTD